MILIVTVAQDLHALTVQEQVRARGVDCHIVECDRIAQRPSLSFGVGHDAGDTLLTSEDRTIGLADASVLWLRTVRSEQILSAPILDETAAAIVRNDCRGGLLGMLATRFRGTWISTPAATLRGSDKIVQLQAAHDSGFRVPRTLVSQVRSDIEAFAADCGGEVVVKTIIGAPGPMLETRRLDPARFADGAYAAAPAIYQEYVRGTDHLRLACFGGRSYAARIRTDDLDWRVDLGVPIDPYAVSADLHAGVRAVLDRLGLEMGIVDIKLTPDGEPVWLEVNPQGQFLFLDAFTGLGLAERFAEYLVEEAGVAAVAAA